MAAACGGGGSHPVSHRTNPAVSPYPPAGTYVTARATAAEKLVLLDYNGTTVAGTLVVRTPGNSATTNLAFLGKIVAGKPVLSFASGNADFALTPNGFTVAQCERWIPGASTAADCTFVRTGTVK